VAIGLVIAVAAGLGVVKAVGGSKQPGQSRSAPNELIRTVANVPASAFEAAGVPQTTNLPSPLPAGTPSLTRGGLPEVIYVGAEYCPFCAAQRWPLIVALSRFGTFSELQTSESSLSDVYPGTKTFTFHGATYSSPYLAFKGVETATNQRTAGGYAPLDTLSTIQQRILSTYNRPPFVGSADGIPFMDLGNRYVLAGSLFDPGLLRGLTQRQIAAELTNPSGPVGQAIDSGANVLTAAICQLTDGRPGDVCSSPAVTRAQALLRAP
jgi:hypothetical protein